MDLTRAQRDIIQELLVRELRAACRSAIDRGARPGEVADLVVSRRRVLADSRVGGAGCPPPPTAGAGPAG